MNKHLQDRGGGVQVIPGSQGTGRQGLHIADDRGMMDIQGETAITGDMPGVWEGSNKGVTGGASKNPERLGKREVGT